MGDPWVTLCLTPWFVLRSCVPALSGVVVNVCCAVCVSMFDSEHWLRHKWLHITAGWMHTSMLARPFFSHCHRWDWRGQILGLWFCMVWSFLQSSARWVPGTFCWSSTEFWIAREGSAFFSWVVSARSLDGLQILGQEHVLVAISLDGSETGAQKSSSSNGLD